MRHSLRAVLAMVPVIGLGAGCDRLTATTQAVSIITRAPNLAEAEGYDTNLDGILPTDPKAFALTGAAVAVGERPSATSTEAPTPITGANVKVTWNGKSVKLCENKTADGAGTYKALSIPDTANCGTSELQYVVGAEYTTTVDTASDAYTVKVVAPNRIAASDVRFTPQLDTADFTMVTLKHHAKNASLTVDWSNSNAAQDKNTFVALFRIRYQPASASDPMAPVLATSWTLDPQNPVYDDAPRSASDMIDLVTGDPSSSTTVPASAFGVDGLYILMLTVTELNTDASSNLAIGSGALAGAATAFMFYVD